MEQPVPPPMMPPPPPPAGGPAEPSFFERTIGQNPGTAAAIIGVLVVMAIVLAFYYAHYRAKAEGRSGFTACRGPWDPAASAEAQALATLGTYPPDGYGERRFQQAVDAARDAGAGPSDEQLAAALHQG